MKAGDKIRCAIYTMGHKTGSNDFVVEEFRYCLGVFESESHRVAGDFTALCDLYVAGPDSTDEYIPNWGAYYTNMVPGWVNIP